MNAHNNERNYEQESENLQKGAENLEPKYQYILDEYGNLTEILKEQCVTVENPINFKRQSAFEVFVPVKYSDGYYVSNYGRLVNNRMHKDKKKFYEHKTGNCHWTVFDSDGYKMDYFSHYLVANTFLVKPTPSEQRYKVWHKDGDKNNNWYKNLIYVTGKDFWQLSEGNITWRDLGYNQKYIEYENKASVVAYQVYGGIRERCNNKTATDNIHACYNEATMCDEWLDDPKVFAKWWFNNYYECIGESMAVDKDLFGNGSKVYSPENCCILPQSLNTMLANAKRHYRGGNDTKSKLPLGVKYNGNKNKYYGVITFSGTNDRIKLADWDTPEEAFEDYKKMKEADIKTMAGRYRDKIPEYIYKKLLTVEVQPY